MEDMASGLSHYLADQGFDSLQEMVGLANNNIVPAEDFIRPYQTESVSESGTTA